MNTTDAHSNRPSRRNAARWTLLNAAILGATAWIAFSQGGGLAAHADAAPPPSSRNIETARAAEQTQQQGAAIDPAQQRVDMTNELRALRTEVSELKAMLSSGRVKTEITNLDEIEFKGVKLEIDYAKLRDAMRAQ